MTEEQHEAILNAIINYTYDKVLSKMSSEPYHSFEEALELYIEELKDER